MKIRKLTEENHAKVSALLQHAFSGSNFEIQLFKNLHKNNKPLHEWICIHSNKVTAYIAFSNAFAGTEVCGVHLAPLAVNPKVQNQGIGSELLRFALRQEVLKETTIFVLGSPNFYRKFGFEKCVTPICPFDNNNDHFLSIRNKIPHQYTVGYEAEFTIGA